MELATPFAPTEIGEPESIPGQPPPSGGASASVALQKTAPVANPEEYPWCTAGKLFFKSDGTDWVGSACVIKRSLLLTVAHNLYDLKSKDWSTHILFDPSYTDGAAPFGSWSYDLCAVPNEWIAGNGYPYDLGVVVMKKGGLSNLDIGNAVGWLGYEINRTYDRSWVEVGYPANLEGGRCMMSDEGQYTRRLDSGAVVGKQSKFEGGSSGAPWLMYGNLDMVNGVHSFHRAANPEEGFSVYFVDWVKDFINKYA